MTDTNLTPGAKLRRAVEENNPLQVVGAVNAYSAIMAEKVGHKAIYLSGGGVAACSMGIPDLGITTMKDVLEDVNRITDASSLPLLVDVDTGWGGAFNIARCTREMIRSGAAGMHIEDQVMQKRCGHRPNKAIVTQEEMVDRVKAAVDAKSDESFVVMARTDALAVEGMESAVERAIACVEAGADMIFPEAINTLEQYKEFTSAVNVPVLANITEFGATPLFTTEELASAGVKLALYPLSAFRAMSLAALKVYQELLSTGTQQGVVDTMQTRMELYDFLDYHSYEHKLDQLFAEQKEE
ncbi:methylisocitrate lyase [Solemya velum gill symbiont]|uniref:2-methylisocitrate lyase n=1 Tax=Solemya velum gill symbiont TaxID=2340 RepID=A0A0B0HA22_SOVGS|nr:methylisocitrate lyase [Solemya velum gill symbiont]KHF25512.1 methylisocitrate lyase [Solemya velum gill symbiont]OOY99751.1 methylisocitrate lyase [Solemya velum gill symbiont]OOZ01937.1 methylisocitrate lyase [Solemya velum gill symbiont]OOZ04339.1 methylisocitrate lyase [Solemya velum gill symbiont]OOZ06517.1 methylisocitrate lyase [Solemya velum gill symbiont]